MPAKLSASAMKVQQALKSFGLNSQVVEMPQSTRTAEDAARAVGCSVGQIAKSLVFKGALSLQPILVVTSGVNRVNEKTLGQLISESITKADPEFVREKTGFAIGGVPPLGHSQPLQIFIDEDLLQFEEIWAAAGTPRTVFKLTSQELQKITGGRIICVK
jgi:prolyl-tRNA editing enzyme YbaK/EbsC (Cys-tRNA(Pro) deacylase)